jgi:single-stranded-DNA-specific exonuclease
MTFWEIKKTEIAGPNLDRKFHPVILGLLANRNIRTEEEIESFFNFNYEKIIDPTEIPEIKKAVERIAQSKERKEKIAVYGDYDADGVTSTVLVYEALKELGFSDVTYYLPDRQLEGYGMNEKAVQYLADQNVKLIITVDCGITSFNEINKAKDLGMDVIITDHHHIPEKLPEAVSIINPNLENSGLDFREYAGVGVAFKLVQALYRKIKPEKIDQLKWALDVVAIGTIADCVPILGENRVLVKYGLIVLSKTRRTGLQEMFKVGRISIDENNVPDAHKVAFQIAPRINAAGRMDHASISYGLMIEKDKAKAREMALEVEAKNQERQKVTAEIVREVQIIAQNAYKDKKFIFASSPDWPVGVLGLVAGKIADEFKKPVIICQKQENDYVGSLRSIPDFDLMEALNECQEHLKKFGGHSQAAGITVTKEKIENFYSQFEKCLENKMTGVEIKTALEIDLELEPEDISWELVNELKKMEPFGEGNPEPVFLTRNMIISDMRRVGNGNGHLKMGLRGQNGSPKIFEAIGFGFFHKFPDLKEGDKINVVYNLQEDQWNGNKKMQMKLIDLQMAE